MLEQPVESKKPVRRSQRTRYTLLKAAQRSFATKGYQATSVDDITQDAGTSHGTFYLYFNNKQEVLEELVGVFLTELDSEVEALWRSRQFLVSIEGAIRAYLEVFGRRRDIAKLLFQVSHQLPARELLGEVRQRFVNRLEAHIRLAQEEGQCGPLDASLAAQALAGMLEHFAFVWVGLEREFDLESVVLTMSNLWQNGIRSLPEGSENNDQSQGLCRGLPVSSRDQSEQDR